MVRCAYEKTKSKDGAAWYAICYANAFFDDEEYTLHDSKVDWAL